MSNSASIGMQNLPMLMAELFTPTLTEQPSLYNRLRNLFNQAQSGFRQLFETPDAVLDPERLRNNDEAWQAFNQACEQQIEDFGGDMVLCCWLNMSSIFTPNHYDNFTKSLLNIHQLLLKGLAYLDQYQGDINDTTTEQYQQTLALFRHYDRALLLWSGDIEDSGQVTRFLPYLPLANGCHFFHYYHARQYQQIPHLKQRVEEGISKHPGLLRQRLAQLSSAFGVVKAIDTTLSQLSQHDNLPQNHLPQSHLPQNQEFALFAQINVRFVNHAIDKMASAIIELSDGQLTQSDWDKAKQPETESHQPLPTTAAQSSNPPPQTEPQQAHLGLGPLNIHQLNRESAFAQLQILADFFAKTEPHSPVSFQIERAIRWGHNSLPEIMTELLGDNQEACNRVEQLVGLKNLYPSERD